MATELSIGSKISTCSHLGIIPGQDLMTSDKLYKVRDSTKMSLSQDLQSIEAILDQWIWVCVSDGDITYTSRANWFTGTEKYHVIKARLIPTINIWWFGMSG